MTGLADYDVVSAAPLGSDCLLRLHMKTQIPIIATRCINICRTRLKHDHYDGTGPALSAPRRVRAPPAQLRPPSRQWWPRPGPPPLLCRTVSAAAAGAARCAAVVPHSPRRAAAGRARNGVLGAAWWPGRGQAQSAL